MNNSVQIPIYQSQTNVPTGHEINPHASATPMSNAIGQSLGNAANALSNYEQTIQRQQEEDGKAYAGKVVSDARVQWETELKDRQAKAPAGASNFTPDLLKDYDAWSQTAISQAPSTGAGKYLTQHLQVYRNNLADQAIGFEAGSRIAWRTNQYTDAADNWAKLAYTDPSQAMTGINALNETMPDVGAANQDKLKDYARKQIVNGAMSGFIANNPQFANDLLNSPAVEDAYTSKQPVSVDVDGKKASLPLHLVTPDELTHYQNMARSESARVQAQAKDDLSQRIQDSSAEALANGTPTNPPSKDEFISAYGEDQGMRKYADFSGTLVLGQNLQTIKNLPSDQLELIRNDTPEAGDGFAERNQKHSILIQAIDQVEQARAKDPVGAAQQVGRVQPIADFSNPQKLVQDIRQRTAVAGQISQDYGTKTVILSETEAKAFGTILKGSPVATQKQYLAALYQGTGDMGLYAATLKQIAPTAPLVAEAGIFQGRGRKTTAGRDIADMILDGNHILNPGGTNEGGKSLIKLPDEKTFQQVFAVEVGPAYAGSPSASSQTYETAKAIYASMSSAAGDNIQTVVNDARWKQSIDLATGGVQSWKGAKIVMPYGLGMDTFKDELPARIKLAVEAQKPINATPEQIADSPLQAIGDGSYAVKMGTGYVMRPDGQPFTIQFQQPLPSTSVVQNVTARTSHSKARGASGH